MFVKLVRNDRIFGQGPFLADEVRYNLIHRICESESSTCVKTPDEKLIFAHSTGYNAWLWISETVTDENKVVLIQKLLDRLEGIPLTGVTGDPNVVELFADRYTKRHAAQHHPYMTMESYFCPKVKKPSGVNGTIRQAARQNVEVVARFMAGFSEEAFGIAADPESQYSAAEKAVETGNLYLWMVEDRPVSMAHIAHRSPRHARINAVYTPPAMRKNGYASAIVAELCSVLEHEGLVPMLYADLKNPDSNKVYKNIGFVEGGQIADIRFDFGAG